MKKWLIRLAWLLLLIELAVMFATSSIRFQDQKALALFAGLLILSLLGTVSGIIVYYRKSFRHWWAWMIPPILFTLSSYVTQGAIPIPWTQCSYFFTMLGLVSIWAVGLTSAFFLWYTDAGLKILAWTSVCSIWLLVIAWKLNGNVLALSFAFLGKTGELSPLWWLYPLFPILFWVLPIAAISAFGHTIRIMIWETKKTTPSSKRTPPPLPSSLTK